MQMLFAALFITFIPIQGILPSSANLNILPVNSVNLRYAQTDLGAEGVSTQDLNFNGNNVTVQKNTNKGLVMTTSTAQASSIFLKEQLKANEVNPGFSTYFVMNVYRLNPGPADGYVFVIAADSNSLGASGGGLGYSGISNSVGVEFDFYDNGGENLASSDIFTNGQSSASAGAVFDGSYINQWATKSAGQLVRAFHTWIEYDHLNTRIELRVAPSNEENPSINRPSRPVNALISRVTNLTQISNYFYAGFTAATGGLAQQMTLKSWYLSNSFIAGGIDPTSPNNVVDSQGPTAPLFEVNRIDSNYELQINGSVDTETSVAGYQYKIGNQPWAVYETTISTNTVATYRARAFDQAGNFSEESTLTIYEIIFTVESQVQTREVRTSMDEAFTIDKIFDLNGYTYATWYDNPQFSGDAILSLSPQNQSVTLYGKPNANIYNISYELDLGETNTMLPATFRTGDTLTLPTPTKAGHSFEGWYFEDTFETPINQSQLPLNSFTAYAKWSINSYTIAFISNEGSNVQSITEPYGSMITQPTNPSRPGYLFAGWFIDETLENPYLFTTMPANDVMLFAKWNLESYSISYILNGGLLPESPSTFTLLTPTISLPEPTREGYTFDGWYLNEQFSGNKINEITTGRIGNLELFAKWNINSYTLTLIHHDAESTTENISLAFQENMELPLLDSKPGYTFVGWSFQNQLITQDYVMPSGDVTLEAIWQGNTTLISFITNTNVIEISSTSGEAIGTLPTLNMPEGYQFLGWSLAPLDASQLITESYVVTNSETLKLYPIWIQSSNLTLLNPTVDAIQLENQDWISPMIIFTAVITLGLCIFVTAYLKNKEHYGA
jgi:uncharacterized repeat protein (TIGR02543 family)